MGRGNWFPGNSLEDVRLVYVDFSDEDADPEDTDAGQWRWQGFRENLMHCLPKSPTTACSRFGATGRATSTTSGSDSPSTRRHLASQVGDWTTRPTWSSTSCRSVIR
jgi:hypothetical protein